MKALSIIALCLCGCARFTTTQTDVSYENGIKVREITTRASAVTLIESKSALANFKANQTDKTQSASVGQLDQEANATNAVNDAAVFLGTLIKAAK
jgi:hypothetical protein